MCRGRDVKNRSRGTKTNQCGKAFNEAMALGVDAKIYDKGVIEKLVGIASMQASGINAMVRKE